MTARDRSRSPRGHDDLPLVEFLVSRHILDDRSAGALRKAPRDFAIDVLVSLGPEVRNPSAFVTRRLAPVMGNQDHRAQHEPARDWQPSGEMNRREQGHNPGVLTVWAGGVQQELVWVSQEQAVADLKSWGVLDEASGDFLLKAPEQDARDVVAAIGPAVKNPSAFVTRKLKDMKASAAQQHTEKAVAGDVPIQVFFNGEYHEVNWTSKEDALSQLVAMGLLDDGSVDFLMKAPEVHAKSVIASIGPEVRNPSAFVTRKLKELRAEASRQGGHAAHDEQWHKEDVIMVHYGGSVRPLNWQGKESALEQLREWGVLDEVSADFLSKAPEQAAKEIIGSIGPEVRNPSAFVTRKVKELQQGGGDRGSSDRGGGSGGGALGPGGGCSMGMGSMGMGGCGMGGCGMGGCNPMMMMNMGGMGGCFGRGTQEHLNALVKQGVLDKESANMLTQIPEHRAKDILNGLGPDVRNPSAWVTRQIKEFMKNNGPCGGMMNNMMPCGGMMNNGMMPMMMMPMQGGGRFQGMQGKNALKIHFNGEDMNIPWTSKGDVLEHLEKYGVLDQKSADYLAKLPDSGVWEILSALGPDVRNPSAFVTQQCKKWQERKWGT